MTRVIIFLGFLLLFGTGIILLQIYLSKKENKWLGLILPAISFTISFLPVLSIAVYNTSKSIGIIGGGDGPTQVIEHTTTLMQGDIASTILMIIVVFLMYNIPTLVLLAIYWGCREKLKKNKELEKMSIQDLQ